MSPREAVISAIKTAINDINETLPRDRKIGLADDAALYGPAGVIDSLTLTLLIVAVEQKIEQSLHRTISLVDMSIVTEDNNAFRNIATLASHILSLIGPNDQ